MHLSEGGGVLVNWAEDRAGLAVQPDRNVDRAPLLPQVPPLILPWPANGVQARIKFSYGPN